MFESVFQSTTIPILQQVVQFGQARQLVLAGNIANLDTPGYRTRDLSVDDFQSRLREAIEERHRPTSMSPGERAFSLHGLGYPNETISQRDDPVAKVARDSKTILYHDDSNVGIEHQVTEMVKNQMRHNLALSIMTSQFQLLQVAISERV